MSSPARKKRKAHAIEADGNNDNTQNNNKASPVLDTKSAATAAESPTHLPAPCLAAVLNFLWYTDVRQCMLAGKIMAEEAARHVETLNIDTLVQAGWNLNANDYILVDVEEGQKIQLL